jgi:hypothetical protein
MIYLSVVLWNIFLMAGSVYLVFEKGASGWWIVLAMLMTQSVTNK